MQHATHARSETARRVLHRVAMCFGVLQYVAGCCRVLQGVARCVSVCLSIGSGGLSGNGKHCNTLHHTATHCHTLPLLTGSGSATHCNTVQHVAPCCATLQQCLVAPARRGDGDVDESRSRCTQKSHDLVEFFGEVATTWPLRYDSFTCMT